MPAFSSIVSECSSIIGDLKELLKDGFKGNLVTSNIRIVYLDIQFSWILFQLGKELAANVSYLIQLGEHPQDLAAEYLTSISNRLKSELALLKAASQV